jgi:hypothetical protein
VPLQVRWCSPVNLGSADCGKICRSIDGCDYVIKDGVTGGSTPLTPHSEWFCAHLSELAGIASPTCRIIEMDDKTLAFGSRWIDERPDPSLPGTWWDRIKAGSIAIDDLRGPLSRIYAFDHFIHNVDRHLNNFLVRGQHTGHTVLANDYSRAWVCHGFPLPSLPMACSTVEAQRLLARHLGEQYIDIGQVKLTVESISKISVAMIRRIIDGHPNDWLTDGMKNKLVGIVSYVGEAGGNSQGSREWHIPLNMPFLWQSQTLAEANASMLVL